MPDQIADWKSRDSLSAAHLNQPLPAVRSIQTITGANGITVTQSPGGTTVAGEHTNRAGFVTAVVKIVSATSYGGKYNGVFVTGTSTASISSGASKLTMPEGMSDGQACIVINLSEDGTGTNLLAVNSYAAGLIVGQSQGSLVVAVQSPAAGVIVKVTGNASGGGKYTGRVCTGTSTAAAAGTLALPEGLTVPSSDDALVLNANEDGKSSHAISANAYLPGIIIGATSDGLKIVVVQGGFTGTKSYLTGVTYNTGTHVLAYQSETIVFVNGAHETDSTDSPTTINTASTTCP